MWNLIPVDLYVYFILKGGEVPDLIFGDKILNIIIEHGNKYVLY